MRVLAFTLLLLSAPASAETCVDPMTLIGSTAGIVRVFGDTELRPASIKPDIKGLFATGFFVSPTEMVTVQHVVEDMGISSNAWTHIVLTREQGPGTDKWIVEGMQAFAERVVRTGFEENVYVLKLSAPVKSIVIPALRAGSLQDGERIAGIGYTGGRVRLATGRFLGIGTQEDGDWAGRALAELNDGDDRLAFDHGASGGPIFDCRGRVVALLQGVTWRNVPLITMDKSLHVSLEMVRIGTPKGFPTNTIVPTMALARHGPD